MYLTKLTLDWMDCLNLLSTYRMHQAIMSAFAAYGKDEIHSREGRVLYRVEDRNAVLVASPVRPDWTRSQFAGDALAAYQVKEIEPRPRPGGVYHFRLDGNPTRREPEGRRRLAHYALGAQMDWLGYQAARHGFEVLHVGVSRKTGVVTQHDNNKIQFLLARFDGVLRCVDSEKLRWAMLRGIGHEKAFGCGMLTLAPIKA